MQQKRPPFDLPAVARNKVSLAIDGGMLSSTLGIAPPLAACVCAAVERARHCTEDFRSARNSDRANDPHRPDLRDGQLDHHAGTRIWRMDRLGLPNRRKVSVSKRIDKSVLALPEPRRIRDKTHLRFVSQQPCLICGRQPSDAHHLRFAQRQALGRKVSDEFTVPLCRGHRREVHRAGDEAGRSRTAGINAVVNARKLWDQTHPIEL